MSRRKTSSFLINKTTIDIIEEEAGKPIEKISQDKLLKIVKNLMTTDFRSKGLKYQPQYLKHRFTKIILEGKFVDFVKKIKNQESIKNQEKYQPSINAKYRTFYDIRDNILIECQNGLKKTHITYICDLSYSSLNENLDNLLRLGLLEYDEKNKIYKTTDLGLDFDYSFQQLRKFLCNEKVDKPIELDKETRALAISALHEIKEHKKTIYDFCALILENDSETINRYDIRHASGGSLQSKKIDGYVEFLIGLNFLESIGTNEFKTTQRGRQYFEAYLNFLLFNYLR